MYYKKIKIIYLFTWIVQKIFIIFILWILLFYLKDRKSFIFKYFSKEKISYININVYENYPYVSLILMKQIVEL